MSTAALDSCDFVLSVNYARENNHPSTQAKDDLSKLVKHLASAGFYVQTRTGDNDTLLVFVKVDDKVLFKQLKSLALKDYLYGLKYEIENDDQIVSDLSQTERLRAIHGLLTYPTFEGGIGITPGTGSWQFINTITPIYDAKFNGQLFFKWLKKPLITEADIQTIREYAGEEVALYFGFLRFYFLWLLIPTVLGFISNIFATNFSIGFTILNSLWAIVFINAWRRKELSYATAWKVKGCSTVEVKRAEFKGESEDIDLITGAKTPYFPSEKRTLRKIQFIPTAIAGGLLLLSYQLACFFIEIFLNEIYQGPGKPLLGLVPTVLIIGGSPFVTGFYAKFVNRAVDNENHETQSSYNSSVTEKLYVHNFLGSYAPLFITIFLYLPFGHVVNSYLKTIQRFAGFFNIPVVEKQFQISTGRLVGQFSFFAYTSLIISFMLENVVPVSIRIITEKFFKKSNAGEKDTPEEAAFLKSVRKQVSQPKFNVNEEYKELVLNFGYLAMFGPIWSLAPFYSLISSYVEIKGDLEKLLLETQRPIPAHVESIDPWNTNLEISTWVGTFITPIITVLFREQDKFVASSEYSALVSSIGVAVWKATTSALVFENLSIILNVIVSALYKASHSKLARDYQQKVLYLRRSNIEANEKKISALGKRDIVLDKEASAWKSCTGEKLLAGLLVDEQPKTKVESAIATGASLYSDSSLHSRIPKEGVSKGSTLNLPTTTNKVPTIPVDSSESSNITTSAPVSTETDLPIRNSSSPSSEGTSSLNGATLPPNFGLKKDPSQSASVLTDNVSFSVEKTSSASENPIVSAAKSIETEDEQKLTKTLDPAVASAVPSVPAETELSTASEVAQVHEKPTGGADESFSSQSSVSTPSKHKKGLFKSIKKKAQSASHSLHLPTTPSK